MTSSLLTLSDLERSKSRSLRILSGRRAVCYTHICQYGITTVIYLSQKGLMQAGGIFRCPSGLSCWSFILLHYTDPFQSRDQFLLVGKHFDGQKERACRRVGITASTFKTPSFLKDLRTTFPGKYIVRPAFAHTRHYRSGICISVYVDAILDKHIQTLVGLQIHKSSRGLLVEIGRTCRGWNVDSDAVARLQIHHLCFNCSYMNIPVKVWNLSEMKIGKINFDG